MWKKNISRDSAITLIKNKRSCIDVNLGFLYQLSKFEDFLNYKNNKILTFNTNGTISLIGLKDYFEVFFNDEVYIAIVLNNETLYKISNGDLKTYEKIDEKFEIFIGYLFNYFKRFNKMESFLYYQQKLKDKNFKINKLLESNIKEEIEKFCFSF